MGDQAPGARRMSSSSITIHNVYVMMAYAFRTIRDEGNDRIATEPFEHLHDLFAEILMRGVGSQVKRGLHHDYLPRQEELATVRGRIDVTSTISARTMTRGKLVCNFDEYEPDTPHNRAVKAVIVLLIRHSAVTPTRKQALRRLLPYLDAVTLIAPTSIRWNELTIHRTNASYRMLLGVCELVVRGLLPRKDFGSTKLASWVSEDMMSSLYERFLREYYRVHHPHLSPTGSKIPWDYDTTSALGAEQLPGMDTDVTLRSDSRTLIIDAKFYSSSLQVGRWGKESVHSNNLYQMLAYTKNADVDSNGSVSGLLLYARTDDAHQPDLDVVIQGNRIGAQTLDLNQPWPRVREQLEEIVGWLEN